ncbi:MAG: hypothetical protein QW701_01730 [Candidatus Nezhaarchaeales archaeon]
MNYDSNQRVVFLGALAAVVAFLVGYFAVPALVAQERGQGVEILEAKITSASIKASEPTFLVVRVSNVQSSYTDFKVLISIKGDVERYVTIRGFNVEKIGDGVWQWSFGIMPPFSEVKYVVELTFNIPSGIAQIKYRIHVDFLVDGSTIDGRDFVVEVLG